MQQFPLTGIRVVEVGSGDALGYCGKLFSDFGAEVIKIEPPGGDAMRRAAPLVDAGDGSRESGVFAWLNTNKASVIADLGNADDVARVRALLATSDLLLDGRLPTDIAASRLSHSDLRRADPALAITALSWFGEHGPYRDLHVTESVCRSLAGLVKLVGPVDGPPVLPRDGQVAMTAGLTAFIPSLAGLMGGAATGARRFAVNSFEAFLQITEFDTGLALESGFSRPRAGINRFGRGYPSGTFMTRHDWLGVTVVTPAQWVAFCELIGLPELGHDPAYNTMLNRFMRAEALRDIITPALMQRTAQEWFERGIPLRLPLAVVPDMAELLTQEVHRSRGAFAQVAIGTAAFDAPVLPQSLTRTPPKPNGHAPRAGGSDAATFPPHTRRASRAATADDPLPLAGMRIIDLTMGWAGPTATRQMADLGADVIKVESCQYPDWFRGTDTRPPYLEETLYEKTYWFQFNNRNKRGITLDLTTPEGLALLRRLLADADAVIDNYAADVMPRLGLDAAAMLAINPRLVVVTMPAFGMSGAWSGARAYGSTLEQASGLPSVNGSESDPPTMLHAALGDPLGGLNGAAALLLGFAHQQATGEGQHIDLSQVQCMLPLVAPFIIAQSITGRSSPRLGNRHPEHVPHGCFPCLGIDQWITIAVRSDTEWRALCAVMRRADLGDDPELATANGRRAQQDRIEAAVAHWTMTVRPDVAMTTLQTHGIAAGIARLPGDLPADPHLLATGHWHSADRPFIGPHLLPTVPWRAEFAAHPPAVRSTAPTLGQHNAEVLSEMLGLSAEEITALATRGVIGTVATVKGKG
ncbi:CoA transferase [Bradyrhizobium sp. 2TAF24]|uniref:CaiB/BaiF CoA-transferase family protein n=1 Tax=Bradyrhizobium sp. 2TAF24 TaxID=3233011 RepID=UPI003F93CBE0